MTKKKPEEEETIRRREEKKQTVQWREMKKINVWLKRKPMKASEINNINLSEPAESEERPEEGWESWRATAISNGILKILKRQANLNMSALKACEEKWLKNEIRYISLKPSRNRGKWRKTKNNEEESNEERRKHSKMRRRNNRKYLEAIENQWKAQHKRRRKPLRENGGTARRNLAEEYNEAANVAWLRENINEEEAKYENVSGEEEKRKYESRR